MISGIYFVEFKANNNEYGNGLAVVDNGKVNGGDHSYLYRGRLDIYGEELRAALDISHYRGELDSVMGPLKNYTLNLTGKMAGEGFDVSGGIPNVPNVNIRIVGRKVAELFK